ncbi:hypothetical protein GEMRC1_007108 [Eukaryota sp. GEM-RC1]
MYTEEFLRSSQLFRTSSTETLQKVLANCTRFHEFQADQIVLKQGDKAGFLYLILSGEVSVYRLMSFPPSSHQRLIRIGILQTGAHFGESAIKDRFIRVSASVIASSHTTLLAITPSEFLEFFDAPAKAVVLNPNRFISDDEIRSVMKKKLDWTTHRSRLIKKEFSKPNHFYRALL